MTGRYLFAVLDRGSGQSDGTIDFSDPVEAIALYRKLDFEKLPLPTKAYARADIYMELDVS